MSSIRVLVVSLSLMACGVPPPCDVRSCNGCCTSTGQCLSGNSEQACGRGGGSCTSCNSTQVCTAGSCFGRGTGAGTASGGGLAAGGGGAGGGGTVNTGAPFCTVGEDCPNVVCECRSGPPVNSKRCVNNRCLDGAQACPQACANFGTCWLGISSGGFVGGSNAGPSTCSGAGGGTAPTGGGSAQTCSVSDLGKDCSVGSQCQSGLCFGASPSFICTKACTTANDCPLDWICEATSAGGRVCMSGREGTPRSTATVCRSVSYPDVGGPCVTGCTGGHCVSNTCTHRCNSASECPQGWSCSGSPFKSCRP